MQQNDSRKLPSFVAYSFLFLVYVTTFRVFATLPLNNLHQIISTVAIILLTIYYLLNLVINFHKRKITKLDILMWLFILVNFLSAFQAQVVFGQPYYYGLMAQRSVLLSISGILLISFLNNRLISIAQVEKTFLIISLSLLAIGYFFFLFVDPVNFNDDEFVAYSPIRGYRYRFQFALVVMLLFYSLFKVSHEKKAKYISIVILVLFYMVYFLQSRTTLVVLAITLLIYFLKNFSLKEKIRNSIIYGGLIIVGTVIFLQLGYTTLLDRYKVLFHNVVEAFIGNSPSEPSSVVRFMELKIALEYIQKNPMLGNGFVSNQWKGGWDEIFGYFYPADIGIIGNIFVFGIIGTILIYLPYYFSLKMSQQVSTNNVFFKTCEYMLLFYFLSMFFSATNIRDSSSIMFLVCLIYYFRYYYFSMVNNEKSDIIPSLV
jgi:hypothetical protein